MIGWLTNQIGLAGNGLAVLIGGGLGALARYGIALLTTQPTVNRALTALSHSVGGGAAFGTTIANLLGCLLLGGLYQCSENWAAMAETPVSPRTMLAIRVGFLGSLTTFSTLVGDISVLGTTGRMDTSLTLLAVNLIGGVLLFVAAMAVVRGMMS